jgi:hypothetical protein
LFIGIWNVSAAQLRKRYLETARHCLVEADRTLDPEAAAALRKLAERFLKEAERYARAEAAAAPKPYGNRARGNAGWLASPGWHEVEPY